MSEYESGKKGGKLVAIQNLQDFEEILKATLSVSYQEKPSYVITGIGQ
jgi:hypothetical protein